MTTDGISDGGTGERGVFKITRPENEKTSINNEMLNREIERGIWGYDKIKRELYKIEKERKISPAPFVIQDTIEPTESMVNANREIFTSRSRLMQHYKDNGYECTWGERPKPKPAFKPDKDTMVDDLRRAFNDAKYGNVELTEKEKEICQREEREYQEYRRRRKRAGY